MVVLMVHTEVPAPITEAIEVSLTSEAASRVEKAVAKLAKLADKLGWEAPTFTRLGEGTPIVIPAPDPYSGIPEFNRVYTTGLYSVVLPSPDSLSLPGGWMLLGTVDVTLEHPIVRSVPGVEFDWASVRDGLVATRCDHCNRAANRHKLIGVRNDDGEVAFVGTTCIADFLGHVNPAQLAAWLDGYALITDPSSMEDDDMGGGFGSRDHGIDVANVIAITNAVIADTGWLSKGKAGYYETSTADHVATILWPNPKGYDREYIGHVLRNGLDRELAADIVEWAKLQGGNDYMDNVAAVAHNGTVGTRHLGLAVSIPAAYWKAVEGFVKEAKRAESTKDWTHLAGEVKDRLVVTAEVLSVRNVESQYGTKQLVKALTENGEHVVWWNSGSSDVKAGWVITGKATIKSHGDFNGTPETTVTRWSFKRAEGTCDHEALTEGHYVSAGGSIEVARRYLGDDEAPEDFVAAIHECPECGAEVDLACVAADRGQTLQVSFGPAGGYNGCVTHTTVNVDHEPKLQTGRSVATVLPVNCNA
jgi:hypothetical protein